MKRIFSALIIFVFFVTMFLSCSAWDYSRPQGFRSGKSNKLFEYRAIAPDGKTVVGIRQIENKEGVVGDTVWIDAIKKEMTRKAYELKEEKEFVSKEENWKGNYLKFIKKYETSSFLYVVVVFESSERIFLVEFTTPLENEKKYLPLFEASLHTFERNDWCTFWDFLF